MWIRDESHSVLFWVVGSPLHLCFDVLLGKSKLCTMLVNTLTKLSNLFAKHIFNETHNGHCTCYQWDQDILTRQKNRFINLLLIYRFDMTWILLYDNINFPFLIIIVFTLTYNFYCYYKKKILLHWALSDKCLEDLLLFKILLGKIFSCLNQKPQIISEIMQKLMQFFRSFFLVFVPPLIY